MKVFLAFILKEFKHILRDKKTLLILFGMPIAQILIFGYGITNEIKNANIAVLDFAKDVHSQKIINKLASSGYFHIDEYLNSNEEIERTFRKGKIKALLVFENNFSRNLDYSNKGKVQIIADATEPNVASTIIHYISTIIIDYSNSLNVEILSIINADAEIRIRYNPEMKGVFLFVPGTISIILMLISAMMTSISITREKELGSMEILLASPVRTSVIIVSKVIPYLALSFINAVVILGLGRFLFGVPINGCIFLLLFECALFIFTALSLGILVSTKTKTQQVALMISLLGLMMPTILLSGFVYPIENMPQWLQYITMLNPATYFITIVRSIMLKGVGLEVLWKETLTLIGFSAFFIILSIKNFKVRLQ